MSAGSGKRFGSKSLQTSANITRADIVAAARRYLGAPLRHQGRYHRAFDCVGLVLAVAEDLALTDVDGKPIRRTDYDRYGPQPVDRAVETECARRLAPGTLDTVDVLGALGAGDVVTLRAPFAVCHVGIISRLEAGDAGDLAVIHAWPGARKVVEHRIDETWIRRISAVFRFPIL
jgi:cell wall-associated NlpC family hydrolase